MDLRQQCLRLAHTYILAHQAGLDTTVFKSQLDAAVTAMRVRAWRAKHTPEEAEVTTQYLQMRSLKRHLKRKNFNAAQAMIA